MLNNGNLAIGALATRTSCSVPTIRYYEEIGLLPQAYRTARGRRAYGETDASRLLFIRRCRDFGFPIDDIRALVVLMDNAGRDCTEAKDLAQKHLGAVRKKLTELRAVEVSLADFVAGCAALCEGGPTGSCVILEDLNAPPALKCCG